MSKIVLLQAENVKRLKAVSVRPSGALVKVGGRNAQGKTSLLDSIQLALGGKSLQPPKVIRAGETTAKVVLETEDLVVTRTWTSKGTYLEVRGRDGVIHKSPQTMLDKLVGSLSFDPVAFMRMDAKKQLLALRELVGVDTSGIEQKREQLYEQRTLVNRDVATAAAKAAALPVVNAPDVEVDLVELLAEKGKLQVRAEENASARADAKAAERELEARSQAKTAAARVVADLEQRLVAARAELEKASSGAATASSMLDMAKVAASDLVEPDFGPVNARIAAFEETNRKVRTKKQRASWTAEQKRLEAQSESLTAAIAGLDNERAAMIAAAKFPVAGLAFDEGGVTFQSLPIEQASAAEQLKVSMAMALARNPELKVALIRDGSLLDAESMAVVQELAEKAGAQVWIEVVGAPEDAAVLIEDGEATGPDAQAVEASA